MSSIEMCIVDHTDYILMQNWMHLNHVMNHLNLQPKEAHDCDFSRVRLWAAEGKSHFYRQNIILSHTPSQYIDALFNKILSRNLNGKIELKTNENLKSLGVKNVPLPIPQIFHRIKGNSLQQAFDNRLKVFHKLINDLIKAKLDGILVYIPSYFDFIRIRNSFEKDE